MEKNYSDYDMDYSTYDAQDDETEVEVGKYTESIEDEYDEFQEFLENEYEERDED